YASENGRRYIGEFRNDRIVNDTQNSQTVNCPYVFSLEGLCFPNENSDDVLKSINSVLLRHIGSLRKIYTYYSQLQATPNEYGHALSRVQLWKFLVDCGFRTKGIPLVEMDRAYAKVFAKDEVRSARFHELHRTDEIFIFRDFIEAIIRISHLIYKGRKDLSIHGSGIPAELSYVLTTDVLPNARGLHVEELVKIEEPEEVVEDLENNPDLLKVRREVDKNQILNSGGQRTMEIEFSDKVANLYAKMARFQKQSLSRIKRR
ncbi:hypothetical protein BC829DRAFT_362393, partial [Chytridium lagenaria]